jgi:ssDNA-binding Zn-finger/Zn-ribbon topoisomerase 1
VIPIHQAIGHLVKCPECGATALVRPSKARVATNQPQSAEISSAAKWCLVDCPKSGKKLYPQGTPVEAVEVASVAVSAVRP